MQHFLEQLCCEPALVRELTRRDETGRGSQSRADQTHHGKQQFEVRQPEKPFWRAIPSGLQDFEWHEAHRADRTRRPVRRHRRSRRSRHVAASYPSMKGFRAMGGRRQVCGGNRIGFCVGSNIWNIVKCSKEVGILRSFNSTPTTIRKMAKNSWSTSRAPAGLLTIQHNNDHYRWRVQRLSAKSCTPVRAASTMIPTATISGIRWKTTAELFRIEVSITRLTSMR